MLLFDIMKDILLDSETKDITNFLVHPIISLSVNEENELPSLHDKYAESDFDKFYQEIIKLSNKDEKTIEEIRLMSLSNKHLKELYS
jgi:cytochrome oxidase Cu insertion factor (SCO1/SenC/PrrC family)